jgi:hypothetical protein
VTSAMPACFIYITTFTFSCAMCTAQGTFHRVSHFRFSIVLHQGSAEHILWYKYTYDAHNLLYDVRRDSLQKTHTDSTLAVVYEDSLVFYNPSLYKLKHRKVKCDDVFCVMTMCLFSLCNLNNAKKRCCAFVE